MTYGSCVIDRLNCIVEWYIKNQTNLISLLLISVWDSLSIGRATVTTPVFGSTSNLSVPWIPNLTRLPSGSSPSRVYTALPTWEFSVRVNWFMSAVKNGGRFSPRTLPNIRNKNTMWKVLRYMFTTLPSCCFVKVTGSLKGPFTITLTRSQITYQIY